MTDAELHDICKILVGKDPYLKDVLLQYKEDTEATIEQYADEIESRENEIEQIYELYADI